LSTAKKESEHILPSLMLWYC